MEGAHVLAAHPEPLDGSEGSEEGESSEEESISDGAEWQEQLLEAQLQQNGHADGERAGISREADAELPGLLANPLLLFVWCVRSGGLTRRLCAPVPRATVCAWLMKAGHDRRRCPNFHFFGLHVPFACSGGGWWPLLCRSRRDMPSPARWISRCPRRAVAPSFATHIWRRTDTTLFIFAWHVFISKI